MADDSKETEVRMVQARRSPAQERSQETVQRIFAAAARVLARGVPFDDVTTGMIATEAGVSVGSLYRFFPDKQAIVDAIAVRHLGIFKEELLRDMMMSPPADGPTALIAAIDAFIAYLDQHADFRTIAYGGRHVSRHARDSQAASDVDGEQLVKMLMGQVLGLEPGPELDISCASSRRSEIPCWRSLMRRAGTNERPPDHCRDEAPTERLPVSKRRLSRELDALISHARQAC